MSYDNPVVHFEMPYEDAKRAVTFYNKAFGWKMNETGEDMGNYVVAETTQTENMRPVTPGAINGGLYLKNADRPAQYPSVVIAVKDINKAMKDVTDAGGEILDKPTHIPGIGMYVSFYDSEGNRVSLLQAGS